jgi:hypothetical protein
MADIETFFEKSADYRHVDYFQNLEKFRESNFLYILPIRFKIILKSDFRFVQLENEIQIFV